MKNKLLTMPAGNPLNVSKIAKYFTSKSKLFFSFGLTLILFAGLLLPWSFTDKNSVISLMPTVKASSVYYDLSRGALTYNLTASTANLITTNDDWSSVASVEGYFGKNLTATHGVDPQTVLGTEFANNALPSAGNTQVNANKGNPSAYNAGGVTEFDTGTPMGIGFQGNVQANPYLVFYLDATKRTGIKVSYTVTDLDSGSNNAVSPLALQYRVGETGNFINVPDGFIADATDGPNVGGRTTTVNITLPDAVNNQPKVQVRIITTNAADSTGKSTPDEWIGINNVVMGQLSPTAASGSIEGRVLTSIGRGITNVHLSLTDMQGNVRTATSTSFGYYHFDDVQVGETYVLTAVGKQFSFSQPAQVLNISEETNEVNFIADPEKKSKTYKFNLPEKQANLPN